MSQFCVAGLAAAGAVLLLPDRHDLDADRDGVTDAAHDRALVSMEAGHALHHGQVHIGVHGEQVADMDPLRPRGVAPSPLNGSIRARRGFATHAHSPSSSARKNLRRVLSTTGKLGLYYRRP